jgi:hypothetical protein
VTFESSEDGGANWTVRYTFPGISASLLVARWYTTYSTTARRIYQPRQFGLDSTINLLDCIQGQWVAPNIIRSTAGGGDKIFVGLAGEDGDFRVSMIDSVTFAESSTVLSTGTPDDHNVPALIETLSGQIMAAYATHSLHTFVRTRLSASVNSDDWGAVRTLTTSSTATYMQLARLAGEARIWMLYRIGSSTAGDWVMRYTDDDGVSWSTERLLAPNTYITSVMDPDGEHLRCFAYAHPLVGSNHDIYYFRVNLATGDVVDSQGTVLGNVVDNTGLPTTEVEQHKAVDVSGSTTTRMYDIAGFGVPALLASEFTNELQSTYYRYTYNSDTGLFTRSGAIATSGPAFFASTSDYFGGACFDPDDPDAVYVSRNLETDVGVGSWELVKYATADNGLTWQRVEVMVTSASILQRPYVKAGRLWWNQVPEYTQYTDFESSVRSMLPSSAEPSDDDTTPDAFSFVAQTGVAISSTITSAAITVSGIDTPSPITVTGGQYRKNGGAATSSPGTVVNGDQVQAVHTSSASYLTATNTVVTIGGVSGTFTSTTYSAPVIEPPASRTIRVRSI